MSDSETMSDFMDLYELKNRIRSVRLPTCCKNPENPSCIDFFLTNKTFASRTLMLLKQDCLISMN